MANITCPQCSRFVDDSSKLCPGCKFNIKKYVKEMKKKGSSVSGSISFGSVYSKTSAGTDAIPELEFLKPAIPAPDKPVAETTETPSIAAAYETPAPAYQEAAPVYEAPAAPVPAYETPAPAPAPVPAYQEPAAYSYDESAVVEEVKNGVSSVDPASLFPKETTPFRPAYKPRVMSQGPVYDPNYKANHSNTHIEDVQPASYEAPAAPETPAYEAPAAPAYEAPAAAAPVPAVPVTAVPVAAPVTPAAPAAPVAAPVAAIPAAPASPVVPAVPVAASAQSAASVGYTPNGDVPPEALLYQRPAAPASPAPAAPYAQPAAPYAQPAAPYAQPAAPYAQPAVPYAQPAVPYQQASPVHREYQAARQVQSAQPAAAYQSSYASQPAPAVSGLFESAALNCGVSGGGALSGEVSGPTILEKLRAEEEQKKANASIFESPNLRAAERELKNGTRQPAGGLHGEIDFENYIAPERGSFGQATAYQIQQAAYVAAGAGGGAQSSIPPYAATQGAGPGGLSYQIPVSPATTAYAQPTAPAYAPQPGMQNGVPAFAAGPGMGNPYAPTNGAIPYITDTPAANANPMLGGGNPVLGGGNANPLLGGGV